jgi:hypothetical protein
MVKVKGYKDMKKHSLCLVVLGVFLGAMPIYADNPDVTQSDEEVAVKNEHSLVGPVLVVGASVASGFFGFFMGKNRGMVRRSRRGERLHAGDSTHGRIRRRDERGMTWRRAARADLGSPADAQGDGLEMVTTLGGLGRSWRSPDDAADGFGASVDRGLVREGGIEPDGMLVPGPDSDGLGVERTPIYAAAAAAAAPPSRTDDADGSGSGSNTGPGFTHEYRRVGDTGEAADGQG